jgi:hypothetical protein
VEPLFPKWTNKLPLILGIGIPVSFIFIVAFIWYYFSPKYINAGYTPVQPVPFSHRLHAGDMGIDCRYCHSTVEKSAVSIIPSTATCMGCHNKVKTESPYLEVVRESYKTGAPIPWVRVHALPRYAHFDHSAHLTAGVGCVSCHGRIDTMEVVSQESPLSMGWCLECHRNPLPHLRPQSELTNMIYNPHESGYDPLNDPLRTDKVVQGPEACGACHY